MEIKNPYFPALANNWTQKQIFQAPGLSDYIILNPNDNTVPIIGVYDNGNNLIYGLTAGLPGPGGSTTIGGYYSGMGIAGSTSGTNTPIFGVLNSSQSQQAVALLVKDNNYVATYTNVLDDGSGNQVTSPTATLLAGTTAGSISWVQPERGTRKVFICAVVGYENDTATGQSITFPVAYLNAPAISVNTSGLTLSVSTTALTITAPNTTTVFNGIIEVVGI